MFLSTMQTVPFEGHNVAYQCLNQSNSVCEYEVNPLTNDKVITEINKLLTQNDKVVKEQC